MITLSSCLVQPEKEALLLTPDEAATALTEEAETEGSDETSEPESITEETSTEPAAPTLDIGGHIYTGAPASEEFTGEMRPYVESAIREYALFFVYQGSELNRYVDPESDLYGYLFGNDGYSRIYNEFYNYEYIVSTDLSLLETADYVLYEDSYFTVNVAYILDVQFSDPGRLSDDNQRLYAAWTFRNTSDGWKLCDSENRDQISLSDIREGVIPAEEGSDESVSIYHIRGKDYDGAVMLVSDASRIFLGTVPYFAYDYGQTVAEMSDSYAARGYQISGGINGGNFNDGGTGSSYTAMPLGIVITEGEVTFADSGYDYPYHLTGLTEDGTLVTGNMTVNEALDLGVRDAVYTTETDGPFLIADGKILYDQLTPTSVYGAGKNPRTAIGQMADGTIIMITINGRQPSSLGASFEDLADIMLELGAENASAMDGGTSSQMIWKGQILNQPFSAFGLRMCPTAWLIR